MFSYASLPAHIIASSPPRTRIVIPVGAQDEAHQSSPTMRRTSFFRRFALGFGLLMLLAALGGYLWWQNYQHSPAYTLALAADAAARNDTETFKQFVDIDSVTRGLTSQVVAQSFRVNEMPLELQTQLNNTMPQMIAAARDTLILQATQNAFAQLSPQAQLPVPLLALFVPRFATINRQGDEATADLALTDNRQVGLRMTRAGETWRVTQVIDTALAAQIAAQIAKRPPPEPLAAPTPPLPIPRGR